MTQEEINAAISEYTGLSGDFYSDLNRMHEAEKFVFKMKTWTDYTDWICDKIQSKDESPMRATAPQRAEAFLRTVGKWRDK